MANQKDHDVSRQIVGAMVMEFLAADRAMVDRLQEFLKELALSAMRAAAAKCASSRPSDRAFPVPRHRR
jgi:hypothetical protein